VKLATEKHEQRCRARGKEDIQVPHREECSEWIYVSESSELDVGSLDQKIGRGMPQEHAAIYQEANTSCHVGTEPKIHTLIREDIRSNTQTVAMHEQCNQAHSYCHDRHRCTLQDKLSLKQERR
jgi:hypothetical protein